MAMVAGLQGNVTPHALEGEELRGLVCRVILILKLGLMVDGHRVLSGNILRYFEE